ncbi:exodeoxyribonuclease VII small subunit [Candidatus Latescibacterota bacterium]
MSKRAPKPGDADDDPTSFEEAMARLEDSVARLESGELTLEESLEIFEQGIAASRSCARLLDQTRKRVQVLVERDGGDFQLEFLDSELAGDDADPSETEDDT